MRSGMLTIFMISSLAMPLVAQSTFPEFQPQVIDANIGKVCYAVTAADVNGDKKMDIVAVSENRVLWYQAPDWQPHVMIKDQTPKDNVCIAPMDIDRDGTIDFALGAGWTSMGTLHWIRRGESLDQPWQVHEIGVERWTHRMRFADVLGSGRPQLVVSPLNATLGNGIRLLAFEVPDEPASQRWVPTVLSHELNRVHNHWHIDFDRDGTIDTLVASREGVHVVRRDKQGWTRTRLGTGAVADDPNQNGAGEIKYGKIGGKTQYIVTVEPMHGTQLVVYTVPEKSGALWNRTVIDKGFRRGHALWTADMDGDGDDEIVFGHSDTPNVPGVNIYNATSSTGLQWQKHVLDAGGVATEDLIVADFTGDGRLDVVAGGRATHNVKLYVNKAR